jgi:hypothetical protein
MRLKNGGVFNKGREQFGLGCFLRKGGWGNFAMKNVYENLIQLPKY